MKYYILTLLLLFTSIHFSNGQVFIDPISDAQLNNSPLVTSAENQAVLGFVITTSSNDTITGVRVRTNIALTGELGNDPRLYVSDDDLFDVNTDTEVGDFSLPQAATFGFSNLQEAIDTNNKYFFFVADVGDEVDHNTAAITFSTTLSDIDLNSGGSVEGTDVSFTYIFETQCAANDRATLNNMYFELGGDSWTFNTNYASQEPLSDWYGVTIDDGGCVTELNLANNNLSGTLPDLGVGLASVNILNLSTNLLSGDIPSNIGSLSQLTYLDLSNNQFTGEIPASLYTVENLNRLQLQNNNLEGGISNAIGRLYGLTILDVSDNQMYGIIPDGMGEAGSLQNIYLRNNSFYGDIPPSFQNLNDLIVLDLAGNVDVIGGIPSYFGDLAIQELYLNNTLMSGTVPSELFALTGVTDFDISATDICEPTSTSYSSWVSGITNYFGSGITCQNIVLNPITKGIDDKPLGGGNIDRALIGFEITSGSANTLNGFSVSTSREVESDFFNYSIVKSDDDDFRTTDDNQELTVSIAFNTLEIIVSGLAEQFDSDGINLFFVADVAESVSESTSPIDFEIFGSTLSTVTTGTAASGVVSPIFDFESSLNSLERTALEDLYYSTNASGNDWDNATNWLSPEPISEWYGIESGGLVMEVWETSGFGPTIADLTSLSTYPDNPGDVFVLDQFKIPGGAGDNYSARIRGELIAPESGNYQFWITGDDEYELYLSTDSSPNNLQLIASGGVVGDEDWSQAAVSALINLVAGNTYFIEVLYAEAEQSDHLTVGWTLPSDTETVGAPTEIIPASAFVNSGGIVKIDLNSNNLNGPLPFSIGSFADLRMLDLSFNNVYGEIPSSMADLDNLSRLDFFVNGLSGSIPADIGDMDNLAYLDLDENNLSGSIPGELGNLTKIQSLWLGGNALSGEIPSAIGTLSTLEVLGLYNNQFSGQIPSFLGNLTNLKILYLNSNQFTGNIPSELNNLTNLELLQLRFNQLSGTIPDLSAMTSLKYISFGSNELTGDFPSYFSNFTDLVWIFVDENAMTGSIPQELSTLPNLVSLGLDRNQFSGSVPESFSNFANLQNFNFSITNLCEPTSTAYQDWAAGLNFYSNTGNSCDSAIFTGNFEEERRYFVENETDVLLFSFAVSSSSGGQFDGINFNFSRDLSGEFSNFRIIESEDPLYRTTGDNVELSGVSINVGLDFVNVQQFGQALTEDPIYYMLVADVSNGVSYETETIQVTLDSQSDFVISGGNFNLTGWFSAEYYFESTCANDARGALTNLFDNLGGKSWDNSENWTSEERIDSWYGVSTTSAGCVTALNLNNNGVTGELPSSIGQLTDLQSLTFTDNILSGTLPVTLRDLSNIIQLDLGRNNFSGPLPDIFDNWPVIETLGLAGNFLEGELPGEIGDLTSLVNLYIDNNVFEGEIPASFENLTNLESFFLSDNNFTGAFPLYFSDNAHVLTFVGFANTDICEPVTSAAYVAWRDDLLLNGFFAGTDQDCSTETDITAYKFVEDPAVGVFVGNIITVTVDQTTNNSRLTADFTLSDGANAFVNDVLQESTVTENDFTDTVTYVVFAEDGVTSQDWKVAVSRPINNEAEIAEYSIPGQNSATLNAGNRTVDVEMQFGTDPANLVPEFLLSAGATASIGGTEQVSGETVVDFSSGSVTYNIVSEDATASNDWTVNLSVGLNDSTDFLSYAFTNATQVGDASIDLENHTVNVQIEFQDDVSALIASFELSTNASATVNTVTQESAVTANDFTSGSVTYTITAQDGSTQEWSVILDVLPSSQTSILSYNLGASQVGDAVFDSTNRIIEVDLVFGTDSSSIIASFQLSTGARAFIAGTEQFSGITPVDFSGDGTQSYLILAQDNFNSSIWEVRINVLDDSEDPVVNVVGSQASYMLGDGGFSVSATATDNVGVETMEIGFKAAASTDYTMETLTESGGSYSKNFGDSDLDNVGITYFFLATDAAGNAGSSDTLFTASEIPSNNRSISYSSFGSSVSNYEIVSFPFANPSSGDLTDDLGAYDENNWRLIRYTGTAYRDFTESGFSTLQAGEGYLLIVKENTAINMGGRSVDLDNGEFNLPLSAGSTGYDLIGNPFIGSLNWSTVVDYNEAMGYIDVGAVSRTPLGISSGNWVNRTTLGLFEGVWIEIFGDASNFKIPVTSSSASGRVDNSTDGPVIFDLNSSKWDMNFYLDSEELGYHIGGVGIDPEATVEKDHKDLGLLPRFIEYLEIEFAHKLTKSVKPSDDIVRWQFSVNSSLPDKEFTLSWDKPTSDVYSVLLIDKLNQQVIDLASSSQITIKNSSDNQFELIFGRKSEIFEELNLDFSSISLLYPNPVSDEFTIEMYSHQEGLIELSLITLDGKELASQEFTASEGINSFLMAVPKVNTQSGMLILAVTTADKRTITNKLFLKR